ELRDSLDIGAALADRSAAARFKDFDLAAAYELYSAVLGPVEPVLSGRSHLIVVPAGALTSLPLQVLVTTKPDSNDYRSAAWLMPRPAVTVLPSVASLKALRDLRSIAPQRYLGFGPFVAEADAAAQGAPAAPGEAAPDQLLRLRSLRGVPAGPRADQKADPR